MHLALLLTIDGLPPIIPAITAAPRAGPESVQDGCPSSPGRSRRDSRSGRRRSALRAARTVAPRGYAPVKRRLSDAGGKVLPAAFVARCNPGAISRRLTTLRDATRARGGLA